MAKNYTYPRVSIAATAKTRSSVMPGAEDTTVLFAPITTEKGPNREVVRIHSLSEFIETFGNLSYEKNGQMALNIYNWLNNGGTVYVYRLAGFNTEKDLQAGLISDTEERRAEICTSDDAKYSKTTISIPVKSLDVVDLGVLDELESATYYKDNKNNKLYYVNPNATDVENAITSYEKSEEIVKAGNADLGNVFYYADKVYSKTVDSVTTYYPDNKDATGKLIADVTESGRNGLFVVSGLANSTPILVEYEKDTGKSSDLIGYAKYYGEYYNDLSLTFTITSVRTVNGVTTKSMNIVVERTANGVRSIVEQFPRVNAAKYKSVLISSEYIDPDFDSANIVGSWIETAIEGSFQTYYFNNADDGQLTDDVAALSYFYASGDFSTKLSNVLETPIDIMFDAGYPREIKDKMMQMISCNSESAVRPDIVGIFDCYELGEVTKNSTIKRGYLNIPSDSMISMNEEGYATATNIAFYDQYFMISDEIFTDQNIYVTPTYFLSKLIARNDMTYGIQFPTAGIRRGVLDDALSVNENPNADTKDRLFKDRINYVEKTPREYAFMNQRTHDGSDESQYTALSFLNNVRVVEKMKKELERLGRNYLFEFNDAITLAQLSDVLNKYVMNWITNRTLATGVVTVEKNPYSDEAVDVTLTIRFNGTIEVISVQITIE